MAMLMDFYTRAFIMLGVGTGLTIYGINLSRVYGELAPFGSLFQLVGIVLIIIGMAYFIVLIYFTIEKPKKEIESY
jgi:hypothetical protein